jgi:signal transduction histidine kinase
MNEVSCKVFSLLLHPLEEKGVTLESIVEGTTVPPAKLRNKRERIDWTDYVVIMRNVRPHFTDEEYVALGRSYMHSPGLKFALVAARLLFSARDFYRWMNKPRDGVGNQMFTCIVPSHREMSENEIQIDLTLEDDYEMVWDFFVITIGNMEELPKLLGHPRAHVELSRLQRGARYRVTIPKGVPLLTRIRRWLTWPFTVRAAARELKEAHESLLEQYQQLEVARTMIDRQAQHLRTAHTLNDLILRDLDLNRLLDTLAKALVEEAGFVWAEVSLAGTEKEPPRVASYGTKGDEPPLRRTLESGGGQVVGELAVALRTTDTPTSREELLALITPTLATGIQNALYRTNLERLVEVRTSELTLARDQLAGLVEQLREAQSARERFFGNISHEIRTPLTIIMLAAADIESRAGAALDGRARAGLIAVTDASRKLVRLVDELLLLAAGQEGKLRLHPEPTDLVSLIRLLASAWLPAAELAQLTLEVRTPGVLVAKVDPVAIERVATNLVSNAVKYTPAGGRVEIELVEEADGVRLSVLDTGPGIDEELAGRLFGRFERSSGEDRRKVGTGLGLSLVKQLVEEHQGTIEARRRPGGGAELRVMLPSSVVIQDAPMPTEPTLRLAPEAKSNSEIESGARLGPSNAAKGTIVIAEDDPALAEMVAKLLSQEYAVIVAHDGVTALEMVRTHQPQLLITDVDMPGMNGIELSRKFREHTGDKVAPIIILSAVIDLGTRVAGLDAGAVDYVTKPFDPVELKARVRAQFRMRELTLRLQRAEQFSMLGILTSGLAHELRNPANGIVNAIAPLTELLPAELTHPETAVGQLLDVVKTCAEQIGFLSRQLLGFRGGNVEIDMRPIPISELVERSITLAKRALVGIDVRNRLPRELEIVCAPPLMTQVLTNLIENAGHAASPGGWVEIRANIENGRINLEIADSGGGVPHELRDRIFEPFFTTKPVGKGTGLGLSVARDIIHRHGGALEIRDRASNSFFVIDLPHRSGVGARANTVS